MVWHTDQFLSPNGRTGRKFMGIKWRRRIECVRGDNRLCMSGATANDTGAASSICPLQVTFYLDCVERKMREAMWSRTHLMGHIDEMSYLVFSLSVGIPVKAIDPTKVTIPLSTGLITVTWCTFHYLFTRNGLHL